MLKQHGAFLKASCLCCMLLPISPLMFCDHMGIYVYIWGKTAFHQNEICGNMCLQSIHVMERGFSDGTSDDSATGLPGVCVYKYLHKARCQICLKQEKLLFLVVSERTLHVKYCLPMFFSPWEGWLVAIELIASSFSTLFLFVHYFERCKWCHSGHIQVLLLPLVRECFTDVSCNQIGLGWLANTPCVK